MNLYWVIIKHHLMQSLLKPKSKSFNVKDWFGSVDLVTFTVTNIERGKYGCYIYTIKSSIPINEDYFPSVLKICEDYDNVVSPTSYSVQ